MISLHGSCRQDGAPPPAELFDGHRLCDLLKDYGLGSKYSVSGRGRDCE